MPRKKMPTETLIEIAAPFEGLFQPARYKVFHGGRGGAKSESFARALLFLGGQKELLILCTRELQTSIADSVYRLLCLQIDALGMDRFYRITKTSIVGLNGTEFIFKGLRHNITEIKSTEGIDIVWVEEAQRVSKDSWDILIPTIRKNGSEIWVSFNPESDKDATYQRFVVNPPPGALVRKVNYDDNEFLPETLRKEMEHCRATDFDAYMHIWEGNCIQISDAIIFAKKIRIDTFEAPRGTRLFFGADWGFANDPTTLNRLFIHDERLWIEYEAHGVGVEIDETPQLFDSIPGSREWPIKADCSRPETISYMRRQGFNISAAAKWTGCEEDGIAHMKGFKEIVIHDRCKHTQEEGRLYRYKTDKITGETLPIIIDKNNHHWDGCRYGLDGYIQSRGAGANLLQAVNT